MLTGKLLITLLVALAIVCLLSTDSMAQHFFSYRFTGGLANYPLHNFMARFSDPIDVKIKKDPYNPCAGLSIIRKLTWESYVFIEIEYLGTSISYDSLQSGNWQYYSGGHSISNYHWLLDLHSLPLSFGYEKRNPLRKSSVIPFYNICGSLIYCTVDSRRWSDSLSLVQETKSGFGYGFFGAFGLSFPVWDRLAGVVKARARYADGLYFSGDFAGFKPEFSSFDLSAGVEYGY